MNWEEYSLSWSAQKCTYKVLAKSRPTTKQLEDLELPELNPVQVDADRFIRILNSPTTVDYGIIQIAQKSLPIESNSKGDVAPKDADSLGNVVPELLLLQEDVASQKLMLAKKEQSLLDALVTPNAKIYQMLQSRQHRLIIRNLSQLNFNQLLHLQQAAPVIRHTIK
jgi:hypothetical protein